MSDQLSGQVLADKYRIDELMREGNFCNLYRATNLSTKEPLLIKILSPTQAADEKSAENFSAEAETLSRVLHPNILNVTDYGTDKNGTVFIAMENAEGETLKETIKREGKFSLERANKITRQIAAALSVTHAGGVNYQNLSSENILLTKTTSEADSVKILDFGAARFNENNSLDEEISNSAAEYLAPEYYAKSSAADTRADVYSLGIILYEMLAGEVPFSAEKPSDVMLKHAQEPPLPLSAFRRDLPDEVGQVVQTALAKNPDSRYQAATDLAAALNHATLLSLDTEEETIVRRNLAKPTVAVTPLGKPQNNIWKTAFIVLAGIAGLSALLIYATTVKQTNPSTELITDANGQPVQPVNPSTGTAEQSLSNMGAYSPDMLDNSNVNGMPQVMPGGDGYDAWSRGGRPPAGAPPLPVQPGGQQVFIDPNNTNSPFMQEGNTFILVPKNTNTNVNTQPSNTSKGRTTNTNAQPTPLSKPSPTPPSANTTTPTETKPTPKPAKPTPKPRTP